MTTLKDVSRPSISGGERLQDPDVPRQPGNAAQVTARPCFAVKAEIGADFEPLFSSF